MLTKRQDILGLQGWYLAFQLAVTCITRFTVNNLLTVPGAMSVTCLTLKRHLRSASRLCCVDA